MSKIQVRKEALIIRKNLKDVSEQLVNELVSKNILKDYKIIAIYYPLKHEINVMKLIEIYKDKIFVFPKVVADDMVFIDDQNIKDYKKSSFGVYEPISLNIVNKEDIDCFIIPCVAISHENRRLGYGKGYYDRYLSGVNKEKICLNYKELTNIEFSTDTYDVVIDTIIKG